MRAPVYEALAERELERGPPAKGRQPWKHWRLAKGDDDIAWLSLDVAGASANTLSEAVLTELAAALEVIETDRPKGLVIRSLKPSGFMVGADIGSFGELSKREDVAERIGEAHRVFDRIEGLPISTVAVIHGYCLGGGLELALACDRRIAVSDARIGFPEVLLGLHPGLGGSVRSTRLIDPVEAMTLMLTGRSIDARRARRLGLVDEVTEERHVRSAVAAAIDKDTPRRRRGVVAALASTGPGRRLAAWRMRSATGKRARREHYPGPYALIDLWEKHGGDSADAMKAAEVQSFSRLLVGDTAQNLIRAFFLREKLKKLAGNKREFDHVHVIGGGAMGGDIAAWCAWQGLSVTLADVEAAPLAKAVGRASRLFDRIGRRDRRRVRDALDRLVPDLAGAGAARADVVIEAVPEKLDLKRKLFADVEPRMKPDAVLASNTSSIPLERLREGLKRPGRLVGLHFFNPVSKMQLVEVVGHDQADKDALEIGNEFVGAIDRLPAPVKSAPGFLVNRALTPYLVEALALVDEGVAKEAIDAAAEDFGMPMGPIELADRVGLDICLEVADVLRDSLDRPMPPAPDWLRRKVENGELGEKSGKGLYDWKDGKPSKSAHSGRPDAAMTDRMVLPMLDVCVTCLREGVVADEDTVDAAMIFATGFAPFRGGPMKYARDRGVADITATLERLAGQHGARFKPDAGWKALE